MISSEDINCLFPAIGKTGISIGNNKSNNLLSFFLRSSSFIK